MQLDRRGHAAAEYRYARCRFDASGGRPHNPAHESAARKILLGVTGGIAAYKSPDLVRRLHEHGAEVQVVMTRGARSSSRR